MNNINNNVQIVYPKVHSAYPNIVRPIPNRGYRVCTHGINRIFPTKEAAYDFVRAWFQVNRIPVNGIVTVRGEVCELALKDNIVAMFSREDLARVLSVAWSVYWSRKDQYYVRTASGPNGKPVLMHNYILNHTPNEITVDHIDRNGLNNTRANLRLANRALQMYNRGGAGRSGTKYLCSYTHKGKSFYYAKVFGNYRAFSVSALGEEVARAECLRFIREQCAQVEARLVEETNRQLAIVV
jgi:hypothetical protein